MLIASSVSAGEIGPSGAFVDSGSSSLSSGISLRKFSFQRNIVSTLPPPRIAGSPSRISSHLQLDTPNQWT